MLHRIADIILRRVDRTINPKAMRVVILGLFTVGIALVGIPALVDFDADLEVAGESTSYKVSIRQASETLSMSIGGVLLAMAVGLLIVDRYRPEPAQPPLPKSLREASPELHKLLTQNRELFRDYYPDNSAGSTTPFRDVDLWREVRDQKLAPNNRRILEILQNLRATKNSEETTGIRDMMDHLIAFEAHLKDPNLDYSEHRFPADFPKLISRLARQATADRKHLQPYVEHLKSSLNSLEIPHERAELFGSVLHLKSPTDVDLLLLLDCEQGDRSRLCAMNLSKLRQDFKRRFHLPLHVCAYTDREREEYTGFRDSLPATEQIT